LLAFTAVAARRRRREPARSGSGSRPWPAPPSDRRRHTCHNRCRRLWYRIADIFCRSSHLSCEWVWIPQPKVSHHALLLRDDGEFSTRRPPTAIHLRRTARGCCRCRPATSVLSQKSPAFEALIILRCGVAPPRNGAAIPSSSRLAPQALPPSRCSTNS